MCIIIHKNLSNIFVNIVHPEADPETRIRKEAIHLQGAAKGNGEWESKTGG